MPQLDTSTYLSQMFWLLITFFSLWFAMSWFIIPRIEEIMEKRRQKIDGYIQKAEKVNKQALQSLEKYEKAMKKAKAEAEAALAESKKRLAEEIEKKQTEINTALNEKIAENEFILAKERQETLAAINEISQNLAAGILTKLGVENINQELLKASAPVKEENHGTNNG